MSIAQVVMGRKFCTSCKHWRHQCDFYVHTKSRSGTPMRLQTRCRACIRIAKRVTEGMRLRGEPFKPRVTLSDTERKRRRNAAARERYYRRMKDPQKAEEYREYYRMYQTDRRRAQGIMPLQKRRPTNVDEEKVPRLDAKPFRTWLVEIVDKRYGSAGVIAQICDVQERTLRHIMVGNWSHVSLDIVDKVLVLEGSTNLHEVYPELYPGVD